MSTLLTLVALVATGHLALGLAGLERPRTRLEWLATAALCGLALQLALAMAALRAFGPLDPWAGRLVVFLPALAGLALLAARGLPPRRESEPAPGGPARLLLVALAGLVVVTAAGAPVHLFDATFHFAYKGTVLYHEGFAPAAFAELDGHVGRVMTHPTYPPGLGLLHVVASWVDGAYSRDLARPLLALFALAPAVWLHASLRHRGPVAARTAALLWLGLPILYYLRTPHDDAHRALAGLVLGTDTAEAWLGGFPWHRADGPSLDGGGDLPLAAFLAAAVVHLARHLGLGGRRGDPADLLVVGLAVTGMLLVKNEGLALVAVLALAAGLALVLGRWLGDPAPGLARPGAALLALVLGALLVTPWYAFQRQIPELDESYPSQLTVENLTRGFTVSEIQDSGDVAMTRAEFIVLEGLLAMAHPLTWNLLWYGFLVALALALRRPGRAHALGLSLPLLVVLGGLAVFGIILLVTPWNLGRLFATGIPDRLYLQLAPLVVWVLALTMFSPRTATEEAP